jgi:putative membrane protein
MSDDRTPEDRTGDLQASGDPGAGLRTPDVQPPDAPSESIVPVDREPDVRFTYANERTFLAWNRTALALIATGVAATQLLPQFHVTDGRKILGVPLIALGALVAITSFRQWKVNERAMRERRPLPSSPMAAVLAVGIAAVSVIAVVLVIRGSK